MVLKLLRVFAALRVLPGGAWGDGPAWRNQHLPHTTSIICKHLLSRGLESFQGSQSPELFHFSRPGRWDSRDSLGC